MENKQLQLFLHLLVVALTASYLVSSVSSSRLLFESSSATDATSGEKEPIPSKVSGGTTSTDREPASHVTDQGYQNLSAAKTTSSNIHREMSMTAESTNAAAENTTDPYFPDYETHDNAPGFNGRRRRRH